MVAYIAITHFVQQLPLQIGVIVHAVGLLGATMPPMAVLIVTTDFALQLPLLINATFHAVEHLGAMEPPMAALIVIMDFVLQLPLPISAACHALHLVGAMAPPMVARSVITEFVLQWPLRIGVEFHALPLLGVMVLLMVARIVTAEFVPHLETLFIDVTHDALTTLIVPMVSIAVITATMVYVHQVLQHPILLTSAMCNVTPTGIAPGRLMAAFTATVVTAVLQTLLQLLLKNVVRYVHKILIVHRQLMGAYIVGPITFAVLIPDLVVRVHVLAAIKALDKL
jgi:hypothetical protein